MDDLGFYPTEPENVSFGYTALGIHTIPSPNNVQITPSGLNPLLSWDAVNIDENDLDGYHVYRKVGSEPWERITDVPQNGTTYLDTEIAYGSKFGGIWIQYHVTTVVTGVESDPSQNRGMWGDPLWRTAAQITPLPEEFALHANVPNPFNPSTVIQYDLPEDSRVTLVIYDLLGREVKSLVLGEVPAGYQIIKWNGIDATGKSVASGVYIYRFDVVSLESEQRFSQSRKLLLLR
ncbi:MAG: FlgD immunoglobulin-like domain containing protein [Fidelibacterota bacterium]